MKKLLLVILLIFALVGCEGAKEKKEEDIALELASEYFKSDIKRYIINIERVDEVVYEGELQPIMEDGLYGTYFFVTYYFDFSNQDYVQNMIVKLWYETEDKKEAVDYEIHIV